MDDGFPSDTHGVNRLIVLVPVDSDYLTATQRIWELAIATRARVHLLGLCIKRAEEPALHRQLVMMSAMLADGRVDVEPKVEIGADWIGAVKRSYQKGDMVICFAEQHAGPWHRPLRQILASNLNYPVYILSGLYPQKPSEKKWFFKAAAWVGSSFIIIGSFILQARIALLPENGVQTTLWILSLIFELWLILAWNNQHS